MRSRTVDGRARNPLHAVPRRATEARRAVRGRLGEATLPKSDLRPRRSFPKNSSSTAGKLLSSCLMAVLPAFTYDYFDVIVLVWLLIGIIHGRKRGMTQELLPTLQWLFIVVLAGLFYFSFSSVIFQSTGGAFNHLWSNITAYVLIAFAIHLVFLWIKQGVGEKLTGSDLFGRAEYYLGMLSGLIRYACMLIVLCALMNSRVYTSAELAEDAKIQKRNFEDIRFPTYGSVQYAILKESFTGRLIEDKLNSVLIASVSAGKSSPTIATKREDAINAILGPSKK
jgi:uncharacterized membrane protein required for colicin V production